MATINRIEPFPADIDRHYFGIWLAGFTDGEGCFILRQSLRGDYGNCIVSTASFAICLRLDDLKALQRVQSFLQCGNLSVSRTPPKSAPNGKPVVDFHVNRAADLAQIIVPFFDAHPLLAKKSRDFAIWRDGVLLLHKITTRRRCGSRAYAGTLAKWTQEETSRFASLVAALKAQRIYQTPDIELPKRLRVPPQQDLFGGI